MTEAEWLTYTSPLNLLDFLRNRITDRQLRLFACACCRHVWHLFPSENVREYVKLAERLADAGDAAGEVEIACMNLAAFRTSLPGPGRNYSARENASALATEAVACAISTAEHFQAADDGTGVFDIANVAWFAGQCAARARAWAGRAVFDFIDALTTECAYLRDIFGSPFHPTVILSSWQTPTVVQMAKAIYAERAFDRMPILGDALEDAGCDDAEMLKHCRAGGEHVRGCWVVDLLLDKK